MSSFLLVAVLSGLYPAQPDGDQKLDLAVMSADALPGTTVQIPMMLFLGENTPQVKEIEVEVCFSDQFLNYLKVETGYATQTAGGNLNVTPKEKRNSGCIPVQIQAVFTKPLASGTLLEMFFEVKADGPADFHVPLDVVSEARTISGQDIEVTVVEGGIDITEIGSIFACFFFMH